MTFALASLLTSLLAASPGSIREEEHAARAASPAEPGAIVVAAAPTGPAPRAVASAEELAALCAALSPAERLRPAGDALARGEASGRQRAGRDAAMVARYAMTLPGGPLAFAPYDAADRELALAEPALLPVPGGASSLWPTEERGLAVEVDAAAARRILDAQQAGRLTLEVVFDLPDDATCGADPRGKAFTLPIEPVEWSWSDGREALARGGAGAARPLASAAQGARPQVSVGAPVIGAPDARRAVAARRADLERCYAEALEADPAVDGLLVVELGPRPSIAADSTGAPELGACVLRAVARARPAGGRAAVPIQFELLPPALAAQGDAGR